MSPACQIQHIISFCAVSCGTLWYLYRSRKAPLVQATSVQGLSNFMVCACRLHPGAEIKSALLEFAKSRNLASACVVSCVGSVTSAKLRLANAEAGKPSDIITLQ